MIVEKTSVLACIRGLYFKVHELSDDRKRPDTRSVQTESVENEMIRPSPAAAFNQKLFYIDGRT